MTLRSRERRWAVLVKIYYHGRLSDGCPFLAGRSYFNRHGDHRSSDEHPPTATFRTRAQARERAAKIRCGRPDWRVVASAVPVIVTTEAVVDG